MNQMEIFQSKEFGSVRIIKDGEKFLFCGTDVAVSLGYSNPRDAIGRHCRCVVKRDVPHPQSPSNKIEMKFIPEGDVYRLIVHSKLPSAKRFEKWIFDEVLPCIRKHGAYITPAKLEEVLSSPEAILTICRELIATHENNQALAEENALLHEKARYFDLFVDTAYCTNIRITAKELQVPERKFVRFLLDRHYVYRSPSGVILPYTKSENNNLFLVKDFVSYGRPGVYTLITPAGKRVFYQMRKEILNTI